ncbi:hypothetical protein KUTeg_023533 [Tegillarca granosa]|uniref:C2H2-type domain-containing protein n=1 Tax=Tegillarca granosa TaxID=220873 RepID=A0ABQ9E841_TEGGR|nr:hypothetical protein KUTeg_023533 [Tegillarca granosa]
MNNETDKIDGCKTGENIDQLPWLQNHDENKPISDGLKKTCIGLNDGKTEIMKEVKQENKEDEMTSPKVYKSQDIKQNNTEQEEFIHASEKSIAAVAAAAVAMVSGEDASSNASLTSADVHADEDSNICPCEICGQEFTNAQLLQQHQCMHAGGQQFRCQTCGSVFEVESDLQAHILSSHDEVKAFTCDICGKSFKKKQYLKKHCTTHEEDRGYKCDICGAKIMGSHQYKNHMTVHKGERPHACTVCDKKFTLPVYLKRHMLIHSGERPFKCEVCEKTFVASNYLITHRKTVHAGIRNFACDYCDKRFYHSGALRNHIRMHTGERPFECNVCKRKFQSSDQVKAHMRKHTGEKPYSCDVCGQKFQRKFSLDDHRRIHFGIKPFKCFICEESFFRQSGLYSHMKSCHEEDRLRCPECDMFCTTHQSLMRHLYVQHNVMQYAEEVKPGKRFNSTAAQEMMLLYKKQVLLGPSGKDMVLSMGINGTEQNLELVHKSSEFSDMATGDSNDGFSVDSPSSSKEDGNKCLDIDEKLTSNKAEFGEGHVREEVEGECNYN